MTEEPKRRRRGRGATPPTANPVDMAMAAEAEAGGAESPARLLLQRQARLVEEDLRHRRWQILGEQAGFALKTLTAVLGLILAVAAGLLVWDATRYQGLKIDPFSVPPELAERGLSGEAAAGLLLDHLVAMQGQTESIRAPGSYDIDWGDSIQVQIPQTGVSIGELQRFLRQWLGQETRISGVIYRTHDGQLAVTARTAGTAGATFVGPESELDTLMLRTAEGVYERTQPYRYTAYLQANGRNEEAVQVFARFRNERTREAAWAYRSWGLLHLGRGEPAEAVEKYRRALEIDPEMGVTWWAAIQAWQALSRPEEALDAARRAQRTLRGRGARDVSPEAVELLRRWAGESERDLLGDHLGLLAELRSNAEVGRHLYGRTARYDALAQALALASLHDPAAATQLLQGLEPEPGAPPDPGLMMAQAAVAMERGRADEAAELLRRAREVYRGGALEALARRAILPDLALALARAGRLEEAEAVAAETPTDCHVCLMARGEVAARAGRHDEAEQRFQAAVRLAPSIPSAYAAWGEARRLRGDLEGALEMFREAQRRGPRWADPLKFEADVLMRRGDTRAAARRYGQAAERAPDWGALRLAWARALAAEGALAASRDQARRALQLNLAAAERIEARTLAEG